MKISYLLIIASCMLLNANDNNISKKHDTLLKVPTAYNKLGLELRVMQNNCIKYNSDLMTSKKIKEQCSIYNNNVPKTFKIGNLLDLNIANGNKAEVKKYLFSLRSLDKNRQNVMRTIYKEVREARKKKDFSYYIKLIENEQVKLNGGDYKFMEENQKVFENNARYIKYIQDKKNNVSKEENNQRDNNIINKPNTYNQNLKNDTKFKYIDLIDMSASYKATNNTLSINLYFKNKASDKIVNWKNGELAVNCKAYENRGDFGSPKKGALIGQKANKIITYAFQTIYITPSSTKYKEGVAECKLNINGKQFNMNSIFFMSNTNDIRQNTHSIEYIK